MESTHFSLIFVASYKHHFAMYTIGKKDGVPLISNVVWKIIIQDYLKAYLSLLEAPICQKHVEGPYMGNFERIEDK